MMFGDDPFECSADSGADHAASSEEDIQGSGNVEDVMPAEAPALLEDPDMEILEDLPLDFVEEMCEEMIGSVENMGGDDNPDMGEAEESGDETHCAAVLAAHSECVDGGYVKCSLPPYNEYGLTEIGRITTWPPEQADYFKRSISCYFQPDWRRIYDSIVFAS